MEIDKAYRKLINTTQLRNNNIRYFWEGLKYSKLDKQIRTKLVMDYWNISQSTLEQIVYPNWPTKIRIMDADSKQEHR